MITHLQKLVRSAQNAQQNAYAPYSGFSVGAAVQTSSGGIFVGANVENVSLGLTMCAERVCIGAAIAAGERSFHHLAIASDASEPTVPCGACRQVIAEFAPALAITSVTSAGEQREFRLVDLLPFPSQGINVPRET